MKPALGTWVCSWAHGTERPRRGALPPSPQLILGPGGHWETDSSWRMSRPLATLGGAHQSTLIRHQRGQLLRGGGPRTAWAWTGGGGMS